MRLRRWHRWHPAHLRLSDEIPDVPQQPSVHIICEGIKFLEVTSAGRKYQRRGSVDSCSVDCCEKNYNKRMNFASPSEGSLETRLGYEGIIRVSTSCRPICQ